MTAPTSTPHEPSHPRERPQLRERALREGIELLSDEELVALVLERGTTHEPLAARVARLWSEAGGLAGLASFGVGALSTELGLGLAAAARLAASIELATRVARLSRSPPTASASSAEAVDRWARRRLAFLPREELWVLLLDARNRIVAERQVGVGGTHACAVTARDVLRPAVREAAPSFVLVHNHPSGDPLPSREDVALTRAIAVAALAVGLALVDHVVVAREGFVSMLDAELYDPPTRGGAMSRCT